MVKSNKAEMSSLLSIKVVVVSIKSLYRKVARDVKVIAFTE